ncbi:hypothetical protein NDU88_002666 [Pleurodeles waltl]|uniref:Uncharacterized protein n=1 Tax=Pleurodeles waltl TaxID=8319 RepID=A0AAV7KSS5_PLEWA|nr:hypothetical protein NDU88_002666 [Pleurodeles waltl]
MFRLINDLWYSYQSGFISVYLSRRELCQPQHREKKKKNAINSSSRQEERLTRGAGLGALHNPSLSPSLFPGVSPPNLFLVTTRGPLYGRGDPLARRSNCGTAPALSASFPGQGSQVASLVRWEFAVSASTGRHVPPPMPKCFCSIQDACLVMCQALHWAISRTTTVAAGAL